MLLLLTQSAAYTLLSTPQPHRLRTGRCVAAENAFESQSGQSRVSARALDQLIKAEPENQKKALKSFKRGKKKSERQTEQKKASSGKGFGVGTEAKRFDRRPSKGAICACDLGQPYETCCGPEHESGLVTNPIALIRARYAAYAYRLPDFLIETTSPDHGEWQSDRAAWKKELLAFCDNFVCEGLEVGELKEQPVEGDVCRARTHSNPGGAAWRLCPLVCPTHTRVLGRRRTCSPRHEAPRSPCRSAHASCRRARSRCSTCSRRARSCPARMAAGCTPPATSHTRPRPSSRATPPNSTGVRTRSSKAEQLARNEGATCALVPCSVAHEASPLGGAPCSAALSRVPPGKFAFLYVKL